MFVVRCTISVKQENRKVAKLLWELIHNIKAELVNKENVSAVEITNTSASEALEIQTIVKDRRHTSVKC